MSKALVHRSAPFQGQIGREHGLMRLWSIRSHQRQALGEMAEQNDVLLKDMGISRTQAFREAAKPFWRG